MAIRIPLFALASSLSLAACAPLPMAGPPAAPPVPASTPHRADNAPVDGPGLVSAADPRAAAAGAQMLQLGGSATDAAIATMLALGVVEPQSSGIGGGGFIVMGDAAGKVETIDGREAAPAAATPTWFYAEGLPMPIREAIPGGRSVGVPGNLRLAALAHTKHGKLAWRTLFEPAIRLARDGFAITPRLNASLAMFKETAALDPAARALFFDPAGNALPVGTVVKNPALAATLERIAGRGADAFYSGDNAATIAAKVGTSPINPAPMTTADIAAYRAIERPPVCGTYRAHHICSMGPPSAGGIIVIQALGQLERFDLKAMGQNSPVAWHLIAESERLAFADRDRFIADPGLVSVPTPGLIDPSYIAARSALISEKATLPAVQPGSPAGAGADYAMAGPVDEHGTTHFVAVDRDGAVASYTSTVESGFGSGLMANGYYLNNELTDFNIVPMRDGKPTANRVEGGKRPRSSMSPVVVYGPDGTLRMAVGGAGGMTIPVQVIRAIIGTLDWGLSAREALGLGVVMPMGDMLGVEQGTALEGMIPALQALGHAQVRAMPLRLKANAIERVGNSWRGAADPRSEGASVTP
ncbi:gamma-glutamyltransferase family protein [Novosphingobium cyanobacteriorum]|uniref:Gamma-glutamyltransferase family protein n=1 Tax=Novosphingobium cyanobacteriorum TaxID=3024215 RepID=A0ABT6CLR1_9SPHN|nr:gamma-glutamyltransferase family protein [Novosphingobium cyanobacteriorum]MDF8333272.1 gamma-glutamyltransferase family protein [Novosphingobium cyanobacteriorum]